jgi:preprotein translocase subunit YajC
MAQLCRKQNAAVQHGRPAVSYGGWSYVSRIEGGTDMLNVMTDSTASGGLSIITMVVYIIFLGVLMYFIAIRPQKKEQKRMAALLASVEVGDTIVTTSGFYGVVIDITDEDCIVEFGNNKNCRIPMKKSAIAEVEKAGEA